MTKVYIIQCSAHDETLIVSVWAFEQEANRERERLQRETKSEYEYYYVDEWEVHQ